MRTHKAPSALVALITVAFLGLVPATQADDRPFYLTIDTPPAPELSPQDALKSFSIAEGFDVELVAAEPLVEDPVAVTWDERGRLYVVEMRGYMPDAFGNGEKDPVGVVARLSDNNRDGRYDTRDVLLDKLILPRAIAIVNEGLLVGEPPQLWLCPSETGSSDDIDCTKKRKLGEYGNQPGSVEHAENGLLTGLDNWLYSAKSNRRLRLRDGELLVEPTLFRGQWGIAQDNEGRLYYNTNSNLLLGDAYDAQQVVAAGNASAPGLGARVSTNDQLFAVRVNTGVNRAYVPGVLRDDGRLNRPTSASGTAPYRGDQFSESYQQDVFVAEPAANAIAQLRLSRDGLNVSSEHITYPHPTWEQIEFFASTDERFRPVDVVVGPDGALYIIDMYRGIIQDHYFLSDELRAQVLERELDKPVGMGRIWRITQRDSTLPAIPDLSDSGIGELIDLLGHKNGWHRDTAQRLLIAAEGKRITRQLTRAVERGGALQAVHALWTLEGRDSLSRKTLLTASKRPETIVQLAALRAGRDTLTAKDLLSIADRVADAELRQQLVLDLAPHNGQPSVREFLIDELAREAEDAYRPAAIKAASLGQEFQILADLQRRGIWQAALEQQTRFVQQLVVQGFRANPSLGKVMLDFADTLDAGHDWLQVAVLQGLYDVARKDGFVRVSLDERHPIFATQDQTLWPAIARARRAFTWEGDDLAADSKPLSPNQQANRTKGAEFYTSRCASCHGQNGAGIASLAPPLVDSQWVTGPSERLARIMLNGLSGPIEVAGETWNGVMPGHAAQSEFTDEVASGLMTHLNRSWGHTGRAIEPEFVAEIRQQTKDRRSMWTVEELMELPINTHYRRYTGRFGSPDFPLQFVYNGKGLEVRSGIFNGPMKALKEDQFLFEPRGLRIEFVSDDAGAVVALRMPSGDGEVTLPRMAQ